jgi:hypothetical protein
MNINVKLEGLEQAIKDAVAQAMEAWQPKTMPQESEQPSEYYTRDELCHMAHISPTTLWRMEQEGLVPKVKFGRTNLYPRKEINDLLASGKLNKHTRKS